MSLTLSRHEQYQDSEAAKYNSANIQFRDHLLLHVKMALWKNVYYQYGSEGIITAWWNNPCRVWSVGLRCRQSFSSQRSYKEITAHYSLLTNRHDRHTIRLYTYLI